LTLDSSAVMAILRDEAENGLFARLIEADSRRIISAGSVLELTIVLERRFGTEPARYLDVFLHEAKVDIVAFDIDQLEIARSALRRYGKGRHPAALNFGDCIAYALAKWSGEPLLFKGTDFEATDVRRVET
jgi:ribonuclease VapC